MSGEAEQGVEQRGAAGLVEMDGGFVEQEEGGEAAVLGQQGGVGEDDADQHGLLLAGAGVGGLQAGGFVGEVHVGAMSAQCAGAGGGVGGAAAGVFLAQSGFDGQGGRLFELGGDRVGQRDAGAGEGVRRQRGGVEAGDEGAACGREGDGVAGHLFLEAGEPGRVGAAGGEQAAAAGHGGFVGGGLSGVAGFQRPDEAIEKAAAAGGAFLEQLVHLRGEPDGGGAGGELGLAARLGAVEPEHPAAIGALGAGADVGGEIRVGEAAGDGPMPRAVMPGEVADLGAGKAAAGAEQGDGLQQVGLAGAVGAGDDG